MSPDEYHRKVRQLNPKQREMVTFNRHWCKNAVISLRKNRPLLSYRVFLIGPGGVGKSPVISIIHHDMVKLLHLSGQFSPGDVTVLRTAKTGVAAFSIDGMTLHSALLLGTSHTTNMPLSPEKLGTLRTKLAGLQILIIDEVSMVGCNIMLLQIHQRLQQLKGAARDFTFGNINVLAVGDLYQLQPVAQPLIFSQVDDAFARLHRSGSLWEDNFLLLELDEIIRQKDDRTFAELLGRVRTGTHTNDDIRMLESRVLSEDDPNYPKVEQGC